MEHSLPLVPCGELRMKISNGTGLEFRRDHHQLSPKGHLNYMDPVAARE